MKIFIRIVGVILALALLAGLVAIFGLLFRVPWLTGFVYQTFLAYPYLFVALAVVLAVFALATLAFIVFAIAKPTKKNIYTLPNDAGRLEITRQSIESGVGITLQGIPEVKRYAVQIKGQPKPGKVKVVAHVETYGNEDFAALGQEIQGRIARDLANSLQMEPGGVSVRINKQKMQEQGSRQERKSTIPRVI